MPPRLGAETAQLATAQGLGKRWGGQRVMREGCRAPDSGPLALDLLPGLPVPILSAQQAASSLRTDACLTHGLTASSGYSTVVQCAGSGPEPNWQAWLHCALLCDLGQVICLCGLGFLSHENKGYQTDVMARRQA